MRKLGLFFVSFFLLAGSLCAQKNPSPQNGNCALANVMDTTICGLNYVQVSHKLGQRFHLDCCPQGVNGLVQPAQYTVSGIPSFSTIVKAYLWYVISGTINNFTCSVTNPNNVTQNYAPDSIGHCFDIWNSPAMISYRQDVTSLISGNGNYYISGLPTSTTAFGNDVLGATLFIVYTDPADPISGTLIIDDGLITNQGGLYTHQMTGFNACGNSSSAKGFTIVGNLNPNQQYDDITINDSTILFGTQLNYWNFYEINTNIIANQDTSIFSENTPGRIGSWNVTGLYFKNSCITCCPNTFSLSATFTSDWCSGNGTATANISGGVPPFTYHWNTNPIQTTQTATGLMPGSYAVYCTDSSGCGLATVNVTFTGLTVSDTAINATCTIPGNATAYVSGGSSPYTYSWNTTPVQTTSTATGLISGNYTVIVTDANGCSNTSSVTIANPNAPSVNFSSNNSNCTNDGSAQAIPNGGTPPYTYLWSPSSQTSQTATGLVAGNYTVIVTDANGCSTASSTTVGTNPMSLSVSTSSDSVSCLDSVNITATSNYPCTFSWSPALSLNCSTCSSVIATPSATTTYTVTATSGCGTMSQLITIYEDSNMLTQNICMVTVDTAIDKNVIVWERNVGFPITAFNIYKETTQSNVYALLGTQPLSAYTTYTDLSSTPQQVAARYKISTVDSCGNESPLSPHHKTIHLTVSAGINNTWNLNWSAYEGFAFASYDIYRGSNNSNMTLIAQVQNNLFSFTDLTPPPGAIQYAVVAVDPSQCNPSFKQSGNTPSSVVLTFSNVGMVNPAGVNENADENFITVFPNPSQGIFTVSADQTLVAGGDCRIEIYDAIGRTIYSQNIIAQKTLVDISAFARGIYEMKIVSEKAVLTKKIILQ